LAQVNLKQMRRLSASDYFIEISRRVTTRLVFVVVQKVENHI